MRLATPLLILSIFAFVVTDVSGQQIDYYGSSPTVARGVVTLPTSGDVVVVGESLGDTYVQWFDASGKTQKLSLKLAAGYVRAVAAASATEVVIVFSETIVKINSTGSVLWSRQVVAGYDFEEILDVAVAPDGSVYGAGFLWFEPSEDDLEEKSPQVFKLDSGGNLEWHVTSDYYDIGSPYDGLEGDSASISITATNDGAFVAVDIADEDPAIIHYDASDGSVVWSHIIEAQTLVGLHNPVIKTTSDGGFIVGGTYQLPTPEMALFRFDGSGNQLWNRQVGLGFNVLTDVVEDPAGGFVAVGIIDIFIGGPTGPAIDEGLLWRVAHNGDTRDVFAINENIGGREVRLYGVTVANDGSAIAVGEQIFGSRSIVAHVPAPTGPVSLPQADYLAIGHQVVENALALKGEAIQEECGSWISEITFASPDSTDKDMSEIFLFGDDVSNYDDPFPPSTFFENVSPAITACSPSTVPISASPSPVSLSSTGIGDNDTTIVTISNDADTTVVLGMIPALSPPFSIVSDLCSLASLAGSATCDVTIAYVPTVPGNQSDELNVPYNLGADTLTVGVSGNTLAPALTVDPSTHTFVSDPSPTTPPTKTYTVTSTGSADLVLGTLSGLSAPFSLQNDGCSGATLATPAFCTFDVKYDPTAAGARTDTVLIASNVVGSPTESVVNGIGLVPPSVVFPVSSDPFHDESPFKLTVDLPGVTNIQYQLDVGWKSGSWVFEFDQTNDTTGWGAEGFAGGDTAMFMPPAPFRTTQLASIGQDYRNFRACLVLPGAGDATRCTSILPLNLMLEPEGLAPMSPTNVTQLPVFEAVWEDTNLVGPIHYVLTIDDGSTETVFDQRISTDGWSKSSYAPGDTARFYTPLADSLPKFSAVWSMRGYDAVGTRESAPKSFNTFGMPVFAIRSTDSTASEAGDTGEIEVYSLTGAPLQTTAVEYSTKGTATPFVDYTTSGSNKYIVVPAGKVGASTLVIPKADGVVDPGEVATLRTEFDPGYSVTNAAREASVTIADGPDVTVAGISQFTPASAGNGGSVTLTIIGVGLQTGAMATLEKGSTILPGLNVLLSEDGTTMLVSFDLLDVETGSWSLKVMSGGSTFSMGGFVVEEATENGLWADMSCPEFRRVGSKATCHVVIHNPDNNDAVLVPVYASGATNPGLFADPPLEPDVVDFGSWSDVTWAFDLPNGQYHAMVVPVIPAGESRSFAFTGAVDSVKLAVGYPLLNRIPDTTRVGAFESALSPLITSKIAEVAAQQSLSGKFRDCVVLGVQAFISTLPAGGCAVAIGRYLVNGMLALGNNVLAGGAGPSGWSFAKFFTATTSMVLGCLRDGVPWLKALNAAVQIFAAFDKCSCFVASGLFRIFQVNSNDPNDKLGPVGTGSGKYITSTNPLFYNIRFENKSEATAPALEVFIEDTLDTSVYDLSTFELGTVYWGDTTFTIPAGLSNYSTTVDLRPANNLVVDIDITLDLVTGRVFWKMAGRDPDTGLPPVDPFAGFLPPNVTSPEGEGGVTFTVGLLSSVTNGTVVANRASIVFDVNDPILTPTWSNTVDEGAPSSVVASLDALQNTESFPVTWSGSDAVAGILDYTIYVSKDDSAWVPWLERTSNTSGSYPGQRGSSYRFYSVARDAAGNVEAAPGDPDAETVVADNPLPVELVSFEGVSDGDDIVLSWSTAAETNNAGFDVEHLDASECGLDCAEADWTSIDFVGGHGTTAEAQEYRLVVTDAATGRHLFRLRQLDFDGAFEYSEQVEVFREIPAAVELSGAYPNPFNESARIDVMVADDQRVKAAVYDMAGRLVHSPFDAHLRAYVRTPIRLSANDLPSGVYVVRVVGRAFSETRRVVVTR